MASTLPTGPRERGSTPLPPGVRRDRIEPLWDRIDRERFKVAVFLTLFVIAAAVSAGILVGAAMLLAGILLVTDPASAPFYFASIPYVAAASVGIGAIAAATYAARSLTHAERRLLTRFGATWVGKGERLEVKSVLHDVALAVGYEHAPPLWVIEGCDRINAFALGMDPRSAVVGVTEGFLDRLGPDDQRAVFANLMSRIRVGDTLWATAVSAVAGPIWRMRERQLRYEGDHSTVPLDMRDAGEQPEQGTADAVAASAAGYLPILAFLALSVIVTELLMAGHERAAMAAAEKADAEGMLLLKDPQAMLSALDKVLEANNTVPAAGEAYSMLFYCWAGFGYAPEDDPEMARLAHLREVLGAEGMMETAEESRAAVERAVLSDAGPPVAPTIEGRVRGRSQ